MQWKIIVDLSHENPSNMEVFHFASFCTHQGNRTIPVSNDPVLPLVCVN